MRSSWPTSCGGSSGPSRAPRKSSTARSGGWASTHLDLAYSDEPPDGLPLAELVGLLGELLASGKLRAWGVLNWEPELVAEAGRLASEAGIAQPCVAQLPYSLAYPEPVESPAMVDALGLAGAGVVASSVLAGGALSGKYAAGGAGRLTDAPENPSRRRSLRVGELLRSRADELGTTSSRLALAFALANPRVASVLFGATSAEQVRENVGVLDVLAALGDDGVQGLRELASSVD